MGHFGKSHSWVINILMLLAVIIVFASMQGCASVVKGTSQEITFKSEPDGATINLSDGRTLGKTPLTSMLKKKSDLAVTFAKEGYKSETMSLTTTMSGWFWGNIVLGGLIGSTVDGISGAINEYSPSQYFVTLAPLPGTTTPNQQRSDAKTFIIASYKDIFAEVNTQPGQYILSLMTLLKVDQSKKAEFVKDLKELGDKYKDIPEFAEQVVNKYLGQ